VGVGEDTRVERGQGDGEVAAERVTLGSIVADRQVRYAMIAAFTAMLGFGMVGPVLPLFARSFHVGYGAVAIMVSAYAFTRLLLDVVAGPVVQRAGERRSATTGVVATGIASALTAGSPTFPLAVCAWALAGAGSAVLFTAVYSYLLKVVPHERMARTLSVFWGSLSVSWIVGAPIGGALGRVGLAVPLWVNAGMCLAAGWVFWRYTTDPPAKPRDESEPVIRSRRVLRDMLRVPAFRAVLFVNLSLFWLFAAMSTIAPLFAQRSLGLGALGVSLALTGFAITELAVLYPAGIASDRYGRKWPLVIGLVGLAVTIGLLGFSTGAVAFAVLLALAGVASGIAGVSPNAMLSDLTPKARLPVAVAGYRFCGDLGYVVGPALAGITAQVAGFRAAFVVAALPGLLAGLFLLPVPETKSLRDGEATAPPVAPASREVPL